MADISPEANAELVRLKHADGFRIDGILEELLKRGEGLERVAEVIERKLASGDSVTSRNLAELIARTKSRSLYLIAREKLTSEGELP